MENQNIPSIPNTPPPCFECALCLSMGFLFDLVGSSTTTPLDGLGSPTLSLPNVPVNCDPSELVKPVNVDAN